MKERILLAALDAMGTEEDVSYMETLYGNLDKLFAGLDRDDLMATAYMDRDNTAGLILCVYLNRTKKVTKWMNLLTFPLDYDESIVPDQVFKLPMGHTLNTLGIKYFVK